MTGASSVPGPFQVLGLCREKDPVPGQLLGWRTLMKLLGSPVGDAGSQEDDGNT